MNILTDIKKSDRTVILLLINNLVPLFGALFLGWEIKNLVLIYWIESAVIGIYNVIKMVKARDEGIIKMFLVPFFIIHYSLFMGVHMAFIIILFNPVFAFTGLAYSVLFMFISHGYSLVVNYFGKGEYKTAAVGMLMIAPYKRILLMHVTVLIGGVIFFMLAPFFPNPMLPSIFLIAIKTYADWKSHNREHFNIFKAFDGLEKAEIK